MDECEVKRNLLFGETGNFKQRFEIMHHGNWRYFQTNTLRVFYWSNYLGDICHYCVNGKNVYLFVKVVTILIQIRIRN